jgi:hypothetical protein
LRNNPEKPRLFRLLKKLKPRFRLRKRGFLGSEIYWNERYEKGWDSGAGSHGKFAEFKAETINRFLSESDISSVIEFGCGDGNQLELIRYPSYLVFDVSDRAVHSCRRKFEKDPSKEFRLNWEYGDEKADLAVSLDVIYHLVEDNVFENYMERLFDSALRYVIIYSSNHDELMMSHIRHRTFTDWIRTNRPDWQLTDPIPSRHPWRGDHLTGSFADFYFLRRTDPG